MAKTMAVITDGVVTNMIWCSDYTPESDVRKDPGECQVGIGDTYSDGEWYRDGAKILTPSEVIMADMKQALDILGITDEPIE